jgi:hypothetical protein
MSRNVIVILYHPHKPIDLNSFFQFVTEKSSSIPRNSTVRNNISKKINSVALVASEMYRPSDRRLLMPTSGDRGCRVVSTMDPSAAFARGLKPRGLVFSLDTLN